MRHAPPVLSAALAFLLLDASVGDSSPGPMFTAGAYAIGTPHLINSVGLADLNRDGIADLVVGLDGNLGVGVALATGAGSFGPMATAFPNHGDMLVRVADFDGDGLADVGGYSSRVFQSPDSTSIFVGYGDGNGGWTGSFEGAPANAVSLPATADLNADGRADLVICQDDSTIAVYLGNTNRTLTFVAAYPLSGAGFGIACGDVAGSAALDVVVMSDETSEVSVFPGNGDGTLGARLDSPSSSGVVVALGQFDSGAPLDLFFCAATTVQFSSGAGGGAFPPSVTVPSSARSGGLVLQDFNHDGKLDVAATNSTPPNRAVNVWLGDGAGGFGPRLASGKTVFVPQGLVAGDVDGGGNIDLSYGALSLPFLLVTLGNGDGTFGRPASPPQVQGTLQGAAAGDFNGDGLLDGVGSNSLTKKLGFARGRGDGTFDPIVESSPLALNYRYLVAGFFDSDAHLDLAGVCFPSPTLSFLRGLGDGTFAAPVDFALGSTPDLPTLVDLDGNGRTDVVVPCGGSNSLSVFLQGPGGLAAPTVSATPPGPSAVRYADLNGDGRLDRVLACTDQMVVQLDDGAGGYTTVQSHPQVPRPGDLALADLDEDGSLDVVLTEGLLPVTSPMPPALLHVLKGHPGGTFDSESIADLDWYEFPPLHGSEGGHPSARYIHVGDFDEDGHVDLLVRDGSLFDCIGARGHGDRTFGRPESYMTASMGPSSNLGDFNNDGHVDLLTTGSAGNSAPITTFSVLLNRAGGVTGVPGPGPVRGVVALAISAIVPNPSRGGFAIDLMSLNAGSARIALHSPTGRVVFERKGIALVAGVNRVALDAGERLTPGVYWVRATRGSDVATRKAVVLPR